MILAILACKIREASNIISVFKLIKFCSSLPRAEQKLSRYRERERERERDVRACPEQKLNRRSDAEREKDVCVRAEQKLSRQTERERERERARERERERERERCVCVLGKQDLTLPPQYRRFSETK